MKLNHLILIVFFAFTGFVGCMETETDCTFEVKASVVLSVTTSDDSVPQVERAEYRVNSERSWTLCKLIYSEGNQVSYSCGDEREGLIEYVVRAEGFEPVSGEVRVKADECHVITQSIDVVLEKI